jgi:hypothetical protein
MNLNRRQTLESFAKGPAALDAALRRFPRMMWIYRTSPTGASIHGIVWELAEREVVEYAYSRCFIATPHSRVIGIDLSAWPNRLGYFYQNIRDAMGIVRALRRATCRFLETLPESAWTYTADLPVHGRRSLDEWLQVRESYLPAQIQRMEDIHAEWIKATSSARIATSLNKRAFLEPSVR